MNSVLVVETEIRKDSFKGHLKEILRDAKPQRGFTVEMVMEKLKAHDDLDMEYNRTIVAELLSEMTHDGVIGRNEIGAYYWNHQVARCHRSMNGDSTCLCCGETLATVGEVKVCSKCPQTW